MKNDIPYNPETLFSDSANYVSQDDDTYGDVLSKELEFPASTEIDPEGLINDHSLYGFDQETYDLHTDEPETGEEVDALEDIESLPPLDRATRLMEIMEQKGFFPQSNLELSRIMALTRTPRTKNVVIDHLDEVYAHQKRAKTDDPKRALRSIVREFENNALNAFAEASFVREFETRVSAKELNPRSGFNTAVPISEWRSEESTRRALTSLARYREAAAFAQEDAPDRMNKDESIDQAKGDERNQRIKDALGTLRVDEIKHLTDKYVDMQALRFEFWKEKLEEATEYVYVTAQAKEALADLQKKQTPKK